MSAETRAVDEVEDAISRRMRTLADEVRKESVDAAFELYRLACLTTSLLECLCNPQPPAVLQAIAQTKFSWPIMYAPHKKGRARAEQLTKKLTLGEGTGINVAGHFSRELVAMRLVLLLVRMANAAKGQMPPDFDLWQRYLIDFHQNAGTRDPESLHIDIEQHAAIQKWAIEGSGAGLPPLSASSVLQWRHAYKDLFKILFGADYEKHTYLSELREDILRSATKASNDRRSVASSKRDVVTPSDLRKQMWDRVASAIDTIAGVRSRKMRKGVSRS